MTMTVGVTEAIRETVVIEASVQHLKAGDPMFPEFAAQGRTEVWWALLKTRTGLLPEYITIFVLDSAEAAEVFLADNPIGARFGEPKNGPELRRGATLRKEFQNLIDAGRAMDTVAHAGDSDSSLAYDVLQTAGVLDPDDFKISKAVVDFVGASRIHDLRERFGENWEVAAEYEYCFTHFPTTSVAYVASAYRFHYYITGDDFAAGYLWRDMECLVHGVESTAIAAVTSLKAAGVKGGVRSSADRSARRTDLMEKMEEVAARNPDLIRLGAEALAELAADACVAKNPRLWAQGRRQVREYLGEISRGEAGHDMKTRHASLFSRSAKTA